MNYEVATNFSSESFFGQPLWVVCSRAQEIDGGDSDGTTCIIDESNWLVTKIASPPLDVTCPARAWWSAVRSCDNM